MGCRGNPVENCGIRILMSIGDPRGWMSRGEYLSRGFLSLIILRSHGHTCQTLVCKQTHTCSRRQNTPTRYTAFTVYSSQWIGEYKLWSKEMDAHTSAHTHTAAESEICGAERDGVAE